VLLDLVAAPPLTQTIRPLALYTYIKWVREMGEGIGDGEREGAGKGNRRGEKVRGQVWEIEQNRAN